MSYKFDIEAMNNIIEKHLKNALSDEDWRSLKVKQIIFIREKNIQFFNLTFTTIPRFIKKRTINIGEENIKVIKEIRKDFSFHGWDTVHLARSWWLLQLPVDSKESYIGQVESFFNTAEVNEQVALYGSLPLLAFPHNFSQRTAVGLRTNIRQVFEAISLDNPYPYEYLEESAWNQMVLKSFFMNIAVNRILGLDKRSNKTLAYILSDYAHERWSAGRPVNPLLWRPVSGFLDERILPDIKRLFKSENKLERVAATIACSMSNFEPAKELLKEHNELKIQIEKDGLNWESLS